MVPALEGTEKQGVVVVYAKVMLLDRWKDIQRCGKAQAWT